MSETKKLFLSNRVVTENGVFSGGILVNDNGIIEEVLEKKKLKEILQQKGIQIEVVDGGDLAMMSGVVDSHVHVNEPGRTAWEGFRTATTAAAAGGITTIVDMPLNSIPPTTTLNNLKTKADAAKDNIYVDVGFWGGVIPNNEECLKDLIKAGVVGFKCFLCPSGVEEFPSVDTRDLEYAFRALEGTGSVLAFHAEIEDQRSKNNAAVSNKDPEQYETYLISRPSKMEENAIGLITSFLDKTDVRVHIVHVSSADVIPKISKARQDRISSGNTSWRGGVTAETCHHYLHLSSDGIPSGHAEFKCAPPIRDQQNKEKLWEYLLDDKLDLVVSDHSPCSPELKCSNYLNAWGGISSLQYGLSLFWTAVSARGLGLELMAKYICAGPASLCSLEHRKGYLKPGLDADIVFFDPDATFVVTTETVLHKNKLTPYLNKELRGVVAMTYLRGRKIYDWKNGVGEEKFGKLLLNHIDYL